MGLFLQAHRAFLHNASALLSRDALRLRVATADALSLDEVRGQRSDGAAIELPLEKVTIVVDTQLILEPRPTSQAAFSIATLWLRTRAGLDAAARSLLSLVQSGR